MHDIQATGVTPGRSIAKTAIIQGAPYAVALYLCANGKSQEKCDYPIPDTLTAYLHGLQSRLLFRNDL